MKTEYQKTSIGEIPKEWKVVRLEDYSELIVPMRDKPKLFDGDTPWIRIEDLDSKYVRGSKSGRKVSNEVIEKMNLKPYPVGTVLCSCSGEMGVCAITKSVLISNQTFIGIVPDRGLYSEYLYYLLTYLKPKLQVLGTGTTIPYLSRDKFEKLKIPLPSLQEQHRIAEVLSCVDDAILLVDEDIAKTVKLKKGLVQKLLTEGIGHTEFKQTRIGKIPKTWKVTRIGDKCRFLDKLRIPLKEQDRAKRRGPYPYYGAQGIIDWIDDYIFDGEYVLFAEDGENLRSRKLPVAFKVTGKFWVNNHAHVLEIASDDVNIDYIVHALNITNLTPYIVGSAQPKLNQRDARRITIPLPSLLEQQRIVEMLSAVDEKLELSRSRKANLGKIKQGLMNVLLTGKKRVSVVM